MIEAQRDSRRQRHISALNESHKFIDQFYDNFCERKSEIKEKSRIFVTASDTDIEEVMSGLTDEMLVSNEVTYVNGIWDRVSQHRNARKADSDQLRENFDKLKIFQKKGSQGFLNKLRDDLIGVAFLLEPQVDALMIDFKEKDEKKYENEHVENDTFFDEVVKSDQEKFERHYAIWKESVVRFHKLKQEDAIQRFLDRMNSAEFVNPVSRVKIFKEMRDEQMTLFENRMRIITSLDSERPTGMTKQFVSQEADKMGQFNDESSIIFDKLVDKLAKDTDNTNEDMDIAEFDLKDFLIKNDAQLEEGQTFDSIMADRVTPTTLRRKLEAKTLLSNSVKYMEDTDNKMNEICTNILNFFKEFATKMDTNKEKLKQTEINFQVSLASTGDHYDTIADGQEEELQQKVKEMTQAIHHVQLNEKLQQCFEILDSIQKTYRNYNTEYISLVQAYPETMNNFFDSFEADVVSNYKIYRTERQAEIEELLRLETEKK